jgi:acetyl-CoA carboxylase, biotin carboxylase subunit
MMKRNIRTVLIANRGEIAVRIMRTCAELGIRTVAVYSDADKSAPHVLKADAAFRLGPAPSRESYLHVPALLNAARASGADAIHPGYGFLSENADFAAAVREAGFVFIGPPPEAIRAMGDKTAARAAMRSAGVPVVPGSDGPLTSHSEAEAFCAQNGFPVLFKAAAGGGGKGMRLVTRMDEVAGAFDAARSEAQSAFSDGRVYAEKYVERPRHVEIQILADAHGNAVHLGERECSIQRRHQKVVEESPSTAIDESTREAMGATAVRAARACGYVNAGTVEFLVDAHRKFYFLEMNTRLQVEHPVTELRTGLDLVEEQLRIAQGEVLRYQQGDIRFHGHAIECRICAEDVRQNFLPATGKITFLRPAQGPGIRDDRGVDAGGEISVFYDPMIAKLIAWAPTREACIAKMRRALAEYEILGVQTNIPFCRFVMEHAAFTSGDLTTHFVQDHYRPEYLPAPSAEEAIAAAAVTAHIAAASSDRSDPAKSPDAHHGWLQQRILNMRE